MTHSERARELIAEWDHKNLVDSEPMELVRGLIEQLEALRRVEDAARAYMDFRQRNGGEAGKAGVPWWVKEILRLAGDLREALDEAASSPASEPKEA